LPNPPSPNVLRISYWENSEKESKSSPVININQNCATLKRDEKSVIRLEKLEVFWENLYPVRCEEPEVRDEMLAIEFVFN
jgi:hypothetical protein